LLYNKNTFRGHFLQLMGIPQIVILSLKVPIAYLLDAFADSLPAVWDQKALLQRGLLAL
jgi:hypothetical protein